MHHAAPTPIDPALGSLEGFDPQSGSRLERLVFNNRAAVVALCAVLTVVLGLLAVTRLSLSAPRSSGRSCSYGSSARPSTLTPSRWYGGS